MAWEMTGGWPTDQSHWQPQQYRAKAQSAFPSFLKGWHLPRATRVTESLDHEAGSPVSLLSSHSTSVYLSY